MNRTKIVLVMLVIAMLATTWKTIGTAVAQKASTSKAAGQTGNQRG